jgi:DNA-binding transcriptional MerR regulator
MTTEREQGPGPGGQPVLTVAAVARRLGVAPSTLRTWDRRYGLGPSAHTAGSHRRYSPEDVRRLTVMRGLTLEGVPPAEAAQIAMSSAGDTSPAPPPAAAPLAPPTLPAGSEPAAPVVDRPSDPRSGLGDAAVPGLSARPSLLDRSWPGSPLGPSASLGPSSPLDRPSPPFPRDPQAPAPPVPFSTRPPRWAGPLPLDTMIGDPLGGPVAESVGAQLPEPLGPVGHGSGRAGGGRVLSLPEASPRARGLARAAMCLDTHETLRLLRDALATVGAVGTWETLVLPVLQGLGERWRATGENVEVEHCFSEAAMAAFRGVSALQNRPHNVRPVLLGCAEGDFHSLPLHALAAALAEQGVGVRMLGVGVPPDALVSAVRRIGPAVVFLFARMPAASTEVLADLPRQRPAPRLVVGGPGWAAADLPDPVSRVETLREAVAAVLGAVRL